MKTIYDVLKIKKKFCRPVVAIGIFDGLHLGHRRLITKIVRRAKALRGTSIVVTFFPHPVKVVNPGIKLALLATLEERLRLIQDAGADVCVVIGFTRRFSRLDPRHFVAKYLAGNIAPREVYVGHNFRFGRNRQGDFAVLRELGRKFGFKAVAIPAVRRNKTAVSSTQIRKFIMSGDLKNAAAFLGRETAVSGTVKRGDGRGRSLGFPTVNVDVFTQAIPPQGVYIVRVILGKHRYRAIANIGVRPSFSKSGKITVEAHIFGFNRSIYGRTITIQFLEKIRDERKFHTRKDFILQLQKDRQRALAYFRAKSAQ